MQMLAHLDECMLRGSMHRTRPGETLEIARIEALSFPADEKATPEGVAMRQKEAGEFFWTLGPVQVCGGMEEDLLRLSCYIRRRCVDIVLITGHDLNHDAQ